MFEPVTLEGRSVTLEPMRTEHAEDLWTAGRDESIWRLNPTNIVCREDMETYVASAIADRDRGAALPFVTIDNATSTIVGSTRFGNLDAPNRRAEIGWTWLRPDRQRTYVNTEAKLLMLTHAFEVWRCIRVEFKTDVLNDRSRNAILRIGAIQEGIFRNHVICDTGRFRDSVYFSIIESEWASVKERLAAKLPPEK